MNYSTEFVERFKQLRYDHKPLFNALNIIEYEFGKFILAEEKRSYTSTYTFADGSQCEREFSTIKNITLDNY